MAILPNTDLQIYANPFAGLGGGSLLPFLSQGGAPYGAAFAGLGAPSQTLPLTAAGFLRQSFPEFSGAGGLSAMLPRSLSERYAEFAAGPVTTEGLQQFRSSLASDEAIRAILQRQELSGSGVVLRGVEQARDLSEIVSEQLGTQGSALANIFAGIDPTVASQDIRNLLLGQESAVGNLAALAEFGTRGGGLTPYEAQAFGAQLLGGGSDLIGLGGGQAFNPFSSALDVSGFTTDLGQQALKGTNLLDINLGLLSLYDTDITGGAVGNIARAFQTGADIGYGGSGGYGTTTRLANLGGMLAGGGTIAQGGDIAGFIDATYRGRAGRGYGGTLPGLFQQYFTPARASL